MAGCFGTILAWVIIIGLIVAVIIYVIVPFFITVAGIGGVYGGGIAIKNYGKAFRDNIIRGRS